MRITSPRPWLLPLLQSAALLLGMLLYTSLAWPLWLVLLPLALLLWLPLAQRPAEPMVIEDSDGLSRLTRDLSHATSHNALSAAGVSFAVQRLAQKLESMLTGATRIVTSAEQMIVTEDTATRLS